MSIEFPVIIAAVVALAAAYMDARWEMTIPNWLTYPTILGGVLLDLWLGRYDYLVGALVVFVAMFLCWMFGWIGGGDMKLAPGLALFLGPLPVLYGVALASAIFAIWGGLKAWRGTGRPAAFLMVLVGRMPGGAVPLAVLMGPLAVGLKVLGV
ncbi:prepilin peptidase [Desulfofundulus salinus]|uniref:Prepilin peptidase n=1 Tax=Desulfofundulus salinus TaxID=2419843 RepID=A0A494WS90_9FIRM|nr:A24 family peptidase [Desulfofundulus salinum]RKO65701.1 prepilin peptidase [Desulfofundulus salinum]